MGAQLPVEADPPQIQKATADSSPIMFLNFTSNTMDRLQLSDYAQRYLVERLSTVPGVATVGVGGTSDLCMHLAKVAATRPLGTVCEDAEGAKLEVELSEAVNSLGIGPQGLGGDSTAFAVHVEIAATHITMNPVAVNVQCHSARRASATFTPEGVVIGF